MNRPFQPDWTSKPGDTIQDIMQERGVSIEMMRECWPTIDDVLTAKEPIGEVLAIKLEKAFGPSKEFWLNREQQYRDDLKRLGKDA